MKKKIEIITARMQKLDPEKIYLIRLGDDFTQQEADLLKHKLDEWGLKRALVVIGEMKITEVKNAGPRN